MMLVAENFYVRIGLAHRRVGRPVPVIIPQETMPGLKYLCDLEVRREVGIGGDNEYVFASGESSIVWAYDSLRSTCEEAKLEAPGRITSTNLRKYMATVTQVLDLSDHQMHWVLNHLGHTMDVHKIHYRATSDLLERTQIAKILMLQDQGRVGEFKNKCLDDIQLEDVVFGDRAEAECPEQPENAEHPMEAGNTILRTINSLETDISSAPDIINEALDEAEDFFPLKEVKERKKPSNTVKHKWSEEEEDEIKKLFKSFFESKTRPKPKHCLKAQEKSKKSNGLIWKRRKDVLKKKLFRMIDKL